MPEAVSNNAVAEGFIGGMPYVYSFGGIDSSKTHSGIHLRSFRYNSATDEWESIPSLPDTLGKIAAAASRVGNIIYIIGGYHVFEDDSEVSSNRVHRYDILNNQYLPDGAPIPTPIDDQVQVVWRDSLIYVISGWSNSGNVPLVQIYDPALDTWTEGTATPNSSRYRSFGASGTLVGDTIYYFGGASDIGFFSAQDDMRVGRIDPDDPGRIEWSRFDADARQTAYRAAAITVEGTAYWIGGSNITYNYDGLAYTNNQGVPPANQVLALTPPGETLLQESYPQIPMDLRGIAVTAPRQAYLAGGMLGEQQVSDKTYLLEWLGVRSGTAAVYGQEEGYRLFPNPAEKLVRIQHAPAGAAFPVVIEILSPDGRLLRRTTATQAGEAIDLSGLPGGLLLLKLTDRLSKVQLLKLIR